MFKNLSFKGSGRWLRLACFGLYCFLQFGCGAEPMGSGSGLYSDAACPPTEVVGQLRKALSKQQIFTTEPAVDGKGLSLYTDSDESEGNRERKVRYKVLVMPVENANKSTISLQLVEVKSRGYRERESYKEDSTASTPKAGQQIMEQIQNICH